MLLMTGWAQPGFGQDIKNTGLAISLTNQAVISNKMGNWTNDAGSVIMNNGLIFTSDDWVNNGTYDANTTGGFILNYSSVKSFVLGGNKLGRLKLNGGAGLTLSSITISDSLTLTNGILTLATVSDVLTLESTIKLGGGNNASYVDGKITRKGNGNLLFPLGRSFNYLPITVYSVNGTAPVVSATVGTAPAYSAGAGVEALISFPYGWTVTSTNPADTASNVEVQYPNPLPTSTNPVVVRKAAGQSQFESMGAQSFSNSSGKAMVKSYTPGLHGVFSVASGLSANFDPATTNASAILPNGFTANWTTVADATSYELDVSADNFSTFLTGYNAKSTTNLSEVITGLTVNTTYAFRVRAVKSAIKSPNSNVVSVTTSKLSQSITFASLSSKTFGDPTFSLSATANSNLTVSYASSNSGVATISGNTVTITGAGATTITAMQAGDATYSAATAVEQTLTVNKANQTITFGALANKLATDPAFDLTATSSVGLPVQFSTLNTAIIEIKGKTVTLLIAGTATIKASQPGDGNYAAAPDVTQTLVVNKAPQTISFAALADKLATYAAFDLIATASSGLTVEFSTADASVVAITGKTVTLVGSGTATFKANQVGDSKYLAAPEVVQTLVVKKADQSITFNALTKKLTTSTPFSLTATATSNLPVSFASDNPNVATVAGNTVTIVGAGTAGITASQAGDNKYNLAPEIKQTLTVDKTPQTISFAALPDKSATDGPFELPAKSSAGLPVSFASSDPTVASINGATVTIVKGGTVTITASQGGDAKYLAAPNVDQTLTVNKVNQTIEFGTLSQKTLGDSAFSLQATASSSLAVSFATTTPGKVSINGSQVTLLAAGQATITVSQSGNDVYNAASEVNRTFCINPSKPVVTLTSNNTTSPTLTSSEASGNQWFKNGTTISGATGTSYNVTEPGIYAVEVTVETCKSARSDEKAIIVTGDISSVAYNELEISPNPSSDFIDIQLPANGHKDVRIFNLNGALMEDHETEKNQVSVDVRGYASGYYLVRVITSGGSYYGKFIRK
jgi:hypothetical protein